jgi:hypothetical protein
VKKLIMKNGIGNKKLLEMRSVKLWKIYGRKRKEVM